MNCYGVRIPGSEACFFNLSTNPSARLLVPDSNSRIFFHTHLPKPISSAPIRVGFSGAKATINDGFVTEALEMSFYELLGIPESGSLPEIKQAYKLLARKYHPDVSPADRVEEYTRRFIRVQEAYETLSDPRRRALYDRDMARGLHLAFSARRRYQNDEGLETRSEWKNHWQSQLSELKRRSVNNKDATKDMSWGARMRMQREESTSESL